MGFTYQNPEEEDQFQQTITGIAEQPSFVRSRPDERRYAEEPDGSGFGAVIDDLANQPSQVVNDLPDEMRQRTQAQPARKSPSVVAAGAQGDPNEQRLQTEMRSLAPREAPQAPDMTGADIADVPGRILHGLAQGLIAAGGGQSSQYHGMGDRQRERYRQDLQNFGAVEGQRTDRRRELAQTIQQARAARAQDADRTMAQQRMQMDERRQRVAEAIQQRRLGLDETQANGANSERALRIASLERTQREQTESDDPNSALSARMRDVYRGVIEQYPQHIRDPRLQWAAQHLDTLNARQIQGIIDESGLRNGIPTRTETRRGGGGSGGAPRAPRAPGAPDPRAALEAEYIRRGGSPAVASTTDNDHLRSFIERNTGPEPQARAATLARQQADRQAANAQFIRASERLADLDGPRLQAAVRRVVNPNTHVGVDLLHGASGGMLFGDNEREQRDAALITSAVNSYIKANNGTAVNASELVRSLTAAGIGTFTSPMVFNTWLRDNAESLVDQQSRYEESVPQFARALNEDRQGSRAQPQAPQQGQQGQAVYLIEAPPDAQGRRRYRQTSDRAEAERYSRQPGFTVRQRPQ